MGAAAAVMVTSGDQQPTLGAQEFGQQPLGTPTFGSPTQLPQLPPPPQQVNGPGTSLEQPVRTPAAVATARNDRPAPVHHAAPQVDDGLTPDERVNIQVYEKGNRSVVNITTLTVRADIFIGSRRAGGSSSGSVLDKARQILTNAHVVEGAREIMVTLYDGNSYPGKLVGVDPLNDIAVLKIDAPPETLFPVELGDS